MGSISKSKPVDRMSEHSYHTVEGNPMRKPFWNSAYKTHSKSMQSSQGKSRMAIESSRDWDRPTFYYENIVYRLNWVLKQSDL